MTSDHRASYHYRYGKDWHEWSCDTTDCVLKGKPSRLFLRLDTTGNDIALVEALVTSRSNLARELNSQHKDVLTLTPEQATWLSVALPQLLAELATRGAALKCGFWQGVGHCDLDWGHKGDAHVEGSGAFVCSGAQQSEHARRQQAVADAARLKSITSWARDESPNATVEGPTGRGYAQAACDVLKLLGDGSRLTDEQPETAPMPSNPMRLAEALRVVETAFQNLGIGKVFSLWRAGEESEELSIADALRVAAQQVAKARAQSAAASERNAAEHRAAEHTARAVLAELEGT